MFSVSFVDDRKVSDHHAIIPTEEFVQLDHMTNEERKIYDLVVRRFISVLYPAYEYEQTSLKGTAAGQSFSSKGNKILTPGWNDRMVIADLPVIDKRFACVDRSF